MFVFLGQVRCASAQVRDESPLSPFSPIIPWTREPVSFAFLDDNEITFPLNDSERAHSLTCINSGKNYGWLCLDGILYLCVKFVENIDGLIIIFVTHD